MLFQDLDMMVLVKLLITICIFYNIKICLSDEKRVSTNLFCLIYIRAELPAT